MTTTPLQRRNSGPVATLVLNAPRARNALSLEMMSALSDAFHDIAKDESVRAVIVAAEGPAFCAGHDLRELTEAREREDGGAEHYERVFAACSALMQTIPALPQPVIAAVEGVATAAGCQLVAACDLAVAGANARFCTPGVDIGLFCSTPAVPLSRAVGRKHAMEMLLTGAMIDAATAHRFGLVNRVAPATAALAAAEELANAIAGKSAAAIRLGKRAFHRQIDMGLAEAYDLASRTMVENMLAPDAAEGVAAFLGKRQPKWPSHGA